eukprot:jgi/Mesen1/9851/ME000070S09139
MAALTAGTAAAQFIAPLVASAASVNSSKRAQPLQRSSFLGTRAAPVSLRASSHKKQSNVVSASWGANDQQRAAAQAAWFQAQAARAQAANCRPRRGTRAAAFVNPRVENYGCGPQGGPGTSGWGTPLRGYRQGPMLQQAPLVLGGIGWLLNEMFKQQSPSETSSPCSPFGACWDVEEMEDAWLLRFELPGYDTPDVKVQVEDNRVMHITAQRQQGQQQSKDAPDSPSSSSSAKFRFGSRRAAAFKTQIPLPKGKVQTDGISAEMTRGILVVTLPKVAPAPKPQPSVMEVTVRGGSSSADSDTSAKADDVWFASESTLASQPASQQQQPQQPGETLQPQEENAPASKPESSPSQAVEGTGASADHHRQEEPGHSADGSSGGDAPLGL